MGITGLIPFVEKASRRANISEFSGCSVAVDSYCWLHKGAFACAEKLVRGEDTDIYIKYCLKYVTMLLSRNIKPVLVFDGRHLPAKAMTEAKRRESRSTSKKRAAELLSLGKVEEARSYMKRSVDITHAMALALIKECRKRNVDCIVAPYEADAQLAYLNMKNIVQLVITEDSDLVLFGCTKVMFKMDLDGAGTLVETSKLPLVMRCPIERYSFDKFRQMCIMSGCDYLSSLPGIGLAKARQFIMATQDPNIANALRKLPSYFNKSQLVVTDEYREGFLKAEATFKHQYVYDPIHREMVRLTDTDDEVTEVALCSNAGELLDPQVAFQLALGNLDPFTLKRMDDWSPDHVNIEPSNVKTNGWNETAVSNHPSIWSKDIVPYLSVQNPWQKKEPKKPDPIISIPKTKQRKKVVNLVSKYVPETEDVSITIENLSSMYCIEPDNKKMKLDDELNSQDVPNEHNIALTGDDISSNLTDTQPKSPILSTKRYIQSSVLKRLSKFPRTILDDNIVESKFFNAAKVVSVSDGQNDRKSMEEKSDIIEGERSSPILQTPDKKTSRNPFRVRIDNNNDNLNVNAIETALNNENSDLKAEVNDKLKTEESIGSKNSEIIILDDENDSEIINNSKKENSPYSSPVKKSPILNARLKINNAFNLSSNEEMNTEQFSCDIIENTYPMETLVTPVASQESFGATPPQQSNEQIKCMNNNKGISLKLNQKPVEKTNGLIKKSNCRVSGLFKRNSKVLPSNQPTLLSKFGFQKRPIMKR